MADILEAIVSLTDKQKKDLIEKLRPIALRALYEQEKEDNWKKFPNRPK